MLLDCKKKDVCEGVICGIGGMCENGECQYPLNYPCGTNQHFANGACVCDTGWYGWSCDKPCSDCGNHGNCTENWCNCDSGWTGSNCSVPIGSFIGGYHMTGSSVSWLGGTSNPPVYIDETIEVTIYKDTLYAKGYGHVYDGNATDTAISYYSFRWMPSSPSNYSNLTFRKNFDDSLFYSSRFGGLGGGTYTTLRGIKIY